MTKNKKGFTLVELVIVIAVIAILAAVLIPTFAGIIERAKDNTRMQKATTARDEYFSGNDEMSSAVDMSGYIIEVDEHYYVVDNEGNINETLLSKETFSENYDLVSLDDIKGASVYKSAGVGGMVNGEFVAWSDLVEQHLVVVEENFDFANAMIIAGFDPSTNDYVYMPMPSIFYPATQSTVISKALTYIDPSITELKFGGNQATGIVSPHLSKFLMIMQSGYLNIPDRANSIAEDMTEWTTALTLAGYGNNTLKKLVLADGVETITIGGLFVYTALESLTIPNSLVDISHASMYGCISLEEIVIDTQNSNLKNIGVAAMAGCFNLKEINFSNSITHIGDLAFIACSGLTSVVLPNSLVLTEEQSYLNIEHPELLSTNGDSGIFQCCINLKNVTLPSNAIVIPSGMFTDCKSITGITLPSTITEIGDFAFSGCSNLLHMNVPSLVTKIGKQAFLECSNLQDINFPNSLTEIGEWAFFQCSSLTQVLLPASITKIEAVTFDQCTSLTNVSMPSVTYIDAWAFSNCPNLSQVTTSSEITFIGVYAFNECTSLTQFNFTSTIERIEDRAFYGTGLTSITLYGEWGYESDDNEPPTIEPVDVSDSSIVAQLLTGKTGNIYWKNWLRTN